MLDRELVQEAIEPLTPLRLRDRQRLQNRENVLFDVQTSENRWFLRQIADTESSPLEHRNPGQRLLVDVHLPRIRWHEADDHVKSSRLAGAVWTQQSDDLALSQRDVYVINHAAPLVDLHQAPRLEPASINQRRPRRLPAARRAQPCLDLGVQQLGEMRAARADLRPHAGRQGH